MVPVYKFKTGISVCNLGDIHRGNNNCDVKLLKKNISIIKNTRNMYWVSTGDMLETAIKSSKSSCYEASTVEEELDDLSEELSTIRKKCLGFVSSNHPNRVRKESGFSLDRVLADRARIPFLGINAVIKIVCGRAAYFCNLFHGTGGGSDGNGLNRALKNAQNNLGCDLYMSGHTHSFKHQVTNQTIVDRKRDKVTAYQTHVVVTGAYLSYNGSYAQDMGLESRPLGSSVAHLSANGAGNQWSKKIKVDFLG
jgi:hypothetical protein